MCPNRCHVWTGHITDRCSETWLTHESGPGSAASGFPTAPDPPTLATSGLAVGLPRGACGPLSSSARETTRIDRLESVSHVSEHVSAMSPVRTLVPGTYCPTGS